MIIFNIVNKTAFRRAVVFFVTAMIVTVLGTAITYFVNPDLKGIMESFGDSSSDQLKESIGIKKVWAYIVNNGFLVPLQMFVLALIPIQFLYLINVISTALIPGILFGVVLQLDFIKGIEIIASTIPHYFVEIFTFCLFAAALFELNRVIRVKVRSVFKKGKDQVPLVKEILGTIKIYGVLILPMIIVAAFLETYIADILFDLFQ
ncbi:stage II sporulation protein M [Paenibacillus massiliensis]|uniref:stage II sporulation protein M n=1 Tax=Paenibacillus massiliensis TaxID=225917 RepID=UPI000A037698|nr:stage II sporulation protein M [Paenibacillus massiliensis]